MEDLIHALKARVNMNRFDRKLNEEYMDSDEEESYEGKFRF